MRTIGDGIAECAHNCGIGLCHYIYRIQEKPRCCSEFESKDVKIPSMITAAGRSNVGGDKSATVIRHRPAVAFDCDGGRGGLGPSEWGLSMGAIVWAAAGSRWGCFSLAAS